MFCENRQVNFEILNEGNKIRFTLNSTYSTRKLICAFLLSFSYDCALIDAEIALEFVPGSFRGLLAMANALYHTASFEYSLLYYYRYYIKDLKKLCRCYSHLSKNVFRVLSNQSCYLGRKRSVRSMPLLTMESLEIRMQLSIVFLAATENTYLVPRLMYVRVFTW